jgi:endonuclease-3
VFEVLTHDYFDWNEVRVSTVHELTEVMKPLNDPEPSATRLKRVLQSVFETHYAFDLEALKKQNIGQAAKGLGKYHGMTPFLVSYVTQHSLGGHSIPVNQGLMDSMRIIGVISDAEAAKGTVPGLERAIPKNKGIEAGMLLHQLGVELHRSPYGPAIRKILQEIAPDCKGRLPKRPVKKKGTPTKPQPAKTQTAGKKAATQKSTTPKVAKTQVRKKGPVKEKTTAKKSTVKTAPVAKKKKIVKKKNGPKKTATKTVAKKGKSLPATKGKKKTANKRLAKRKPR